ncbi:YibE/F family protein [Paucilactobacillus wasatchensis]|uniref:Integral membrane protein n=1 Tax=Paucilactobacillus wasatchensis TaxID=1335616 RepID=A0A0D0Y7L0_9LACO|nr:YibE/F family protein [Paucilactobacillus wasatchensis]KIS04253.1 hypothetical protein WDC_0184 [Paucilactobacillus wasatchensis]
MTTITGLGLVLLMLMVIVGGRQGWKAFLSLILNFGFLFMAVILIAFHLPPLAVTLVTGVIILAITIFMGDDDLVTTQTAFYASLVVLVLLVLLIIPVEHWAMVQGFGEEDSDDLEGMSILIGIKFLKIAVTTTVLSTLGAIAEAAMAIAAGLAEIVQQHPQITAQALFKNGISVGEQIIGTTFNTLFFGFFGGFLALFIWFAGLHYSFGEIVNNKIFVAELIMVLVSFVGVILTVPITAFVMGRRQQRSLTK